MRCSLYHGLVVLWLAITSLAGCGPAVLSAEDVIVAPGQVARFSGYLDRQVLHGSIVGFPVRFHAKGKLIGEALTDAEGVATARIAMQDKLDTYEARAVVDGREVIGKGEVYHWNPSKTGVAIDVDDTISQTNYSSLFITEYDNSSPPLGHAAQTLRGMKDRYQLVYISARPRWLHSKTKRWLDQNGFPPGPVLHASKFEACFQQEAYKQRMLAAFRRDFPSLLIGVGDKAADDRAYGANQMLGVILGTREDAFRSHCVVQRDWRGVESFFRDHGDSLDDARKLAAAIRSNHMNLRPLFSERSPARLASGAAFPASGKQPSVREPNHPDSPNQPAQPRQPYLTSGLE